MKDLMSTLGYKFQNLALLRTALTHKSFSSEHNERLEFLGDALLNLYVTEYLYDRFDSLDEGKLTQFKATIVSRENLTKIAQSIGLSNFIRTGKGEGLEGNSIPGNAVEALIGAVFLDSNHSKTNRFLNKLLKENLLTLEESADLKDPKSKLQEHLQKRNLQLPLYSLKQKGSKEKKIDFKVFCEVKDLNISATGNGQSRKKAELSAAQKLLNKVEIS
ncbi:MAG TPA: ribonuclease III [SAR86 cluster bacterium]|jgi:ribonuclease-3|nr:ribonuclease III [SAR86 cluster bacterium]HJM15146.1 ribonuclease III [SAR86 cluster bacterium]|tara:strand:- start:1536 stop:2189 length:654 start_codon:yes stop_codon:yes gene_type:complete